ncbi:MULTISPECIES: D-2-hydroxyacid dehydrogenase [Segatella]|jgi:glycerate dehydrogenase|uniref:Glycerate dehydrogenase n=2 Tax=Segatella TaxID=2974251 RepID=D8DWM6_9BACT|nr:MULTISPECIES: D-2-hydroxyacid dehydrogenase [Segatella]MEE3415824.1 D-2-hydroxyacid dehydrogenase [Prevotella sp.]EFI72286.1 glycerate dehydrogenase [Segatella baroniae B14]MDR4930729.1 D-2-hydroxyacid dehydrogenase [Segatella bryantii]OYP53499.1 glycerate dehydrogenase [Segatella bryantii]UKK73772.1 D-2-hydroxyacid dehydrogenase [Segatella bryantii]
MKIVILDGYTANPGDLSWDGLKEYGELIVYPRTKKEDVVSRAKDAEIVLTNKVVLDAEVLIQLPKLKYIGVLATGYNVVDIKKAKELGILVTNIPAYSTDSVAQATFALILNMTNRVAHYANKNRLGRWSDNDDFCYWDTPLRELAGKTLGIVGLGSIGWKVAHLALDFGMDVFAYTSKNAADLPDGIQKTTLEGLFSVSDILTLHCPLTEETYELINKNTLAKMKDGTILINTGRGPLVNEADVAEALQTGKLLYYGADVMCQEPPSKDNPLLKQKNAFITPHIAWATEEARTRLIDTCVENVKSFVEGQPINVVNR